VVVVRDAQAATTITATPTAATKAVVALDRNSLNTHLLSAVVLNFKAKHHRNWEDLSANNPWASLKEAKEALWAMTSVPKLKIYSVWAVHKNLELKQISRKRHPRARKKKLLCEEISGFLWKVNAPLQK
jgi:hypothetical protein